LPWVAAAQTEEEVGDLASFGKEAKFFGYAITGTILVRRNCSPVVPGPDDRCFTINAATNTVSFDVKDIGRIHFPVKTFENVIYLLSRHQYSYIFLNSTTQNKTGRFEYSPYLTLESDVLNDPSLINPQTGQPFNGKLDIFVAGGRSFSKTLFPNYQEFDNIVTGTSSTSGFTKKFFKDNYGLPMPIIDNLFYEKITIRLNIRGFTTNVENAGFGFGVRFIGN
jgi:hypothetical protein